MQVKELLTLKNSNSNPIASILWLVSEKLLSLFLSFFITLAIARHLLPETFGKLNYLLAMVTLVGPLMAVGLNSIISREVLKRPSDNDLIMGSAATLRLLASVIVIPSVIGIAYFYLEPADHSLFAFLIMCSFFNVLLVVDYWLQAHVANRYGALLRLATLLIFSAA